MTDNTCSFLGLQSNWAAQHKVLGTSTVEKPFPSFQLWSGCSTSNIFHNCPIFQPFFWPFRGSLTEAEKSFSFKAFTFTKEIGMQTKERVAKDFVSIFYKREVKEEQSVSNGLPTVSYCVLTATTIGLSTLFIIHLNEIRERTKKRRWLQKSAGKSLIPLIMAKFY